MKKLIERPMVVAFEKNFPEVILGVATIAFGVLLVLPPDSFAPGTGYDIVSGLAPTWVWGAGFLSLGFCNIWAVLRRKGNLVRFSAKLLFFMWFVLGFMFVIESYQYPDWVLMMCLAILYGGVSSEYRTKTKWHDGTGGPGLDL